MNSLFAGTTSLESPENAIIFRLWACEAPPAEEWQRVPVSRPDSPGEGWLFAEPLYAGAAAMQVMLACSWLHSRLTAYRPATPNQSSVGHAKCEVGI
eukprot:347329-Chlamydomonas_euryale.AAC.3